MAVTTGPDVTTAGVWPVSFAVPPVPLMTGPTESDIPAAGVWQAAVAILPAENGGGGGNTGFPGGTNRLFGTSVPNHIP